MTRHLKIHQKNSTSTPSEANNGRIVCPICKRKFPTLCGLRTHVANEHDIIAEEKRIIFENEEGKYIYIPKYLLFVYDTVWVISHLAI